MALADAYWLAQCHSAFNYCFDQIRTELPYRIEWDYPQIPIERRNLRSLSFGSATVSKRPARMDTGRLTAHQPFFVK
jgi:hypothetical protein